MAADHDAIWSDWRDLVNIPPAKLECWLETDASKSVGWDSGDGEAVGHKSGERIVAIRGKKKDDLSDADWAHMAKVVGYIKRHLAQRPKGDISDTRWRHSLMNWGHDPLKD